LSPVESSRLGSRVEDEGEGPAKVVYSDIAKAGAAVVDEGVKVDDGPPKPW